MAKKLEQDYRGYKITVSKENCMGGWPLTYSNVYRISDNTFVVDNFTEDQSNIRSHAKWLRERIDRELLKETPWDDEN